MRPETQTLVSTAARGTTPGVTHGLVDVALHLLGVEGALGCNMSSPLEQQGQAGACPLGSLCHGRVQPLLDGSPPEFFHRAAGLLGQTAQLGYAF